MIHVVDTHALVRYLEGLNRLGAEGRRILTDPRARFIVPTIVLAEARWMIRREQTTLTWEDIMGPLEADRRFAVDPLTLGIVARIDVALEMHDAMVCATAVLYEEASGERVPVIARDRQIRASGLVQTVW